MARLLSISDVAGMLLFSAIIIVIAVLGYRVIHKLGKVASVVGVLAFVYLFVTLLLSANLPAIAQNNHFSLPMFLLAVSLSSSWQIAFCPTFPITLAICRAMSRARKRFCASSAVRCWGLRHR
ncbi:Cytosine/purine/uracil/thiamine/allantoin permease family protein [Raoultella ornithinolytica]|nr:Cytosine/purine/uracil/thiamine/allantoin permease family protein [Raoultella ornithinolytica]